LTCTHSDTLAGEVRALADTLLERLAPLLDGANVPGTPASCANCPVCAVLALLRGERPELAVTLANHAAGVLTALRSLMEEWPDAGPSRSGAQGEGNGTAHTRPERPRVQHIPVTRV
jgi:hypothetical protein